MKKLFIAFALCIFLSACSQTTVLETSELKIPAQCTNWFDGCNNCMVMDDGGLACTKMFCPEESMEEPTCTKFKEDIVVIPEEDLLICTMEYAPVCGVNGQTYGNKCSAGKTEISHEGECLSEEKIPDIAEKNNENNKITNSYRNEIEYNCINWFDGCNNCMVGDNGELGCTRMFCPEETIGEPKCTKFKEEAALPEEDMLICTMEYAPVCGINGTTYGNKCSAGGAEIAYKGECETEVKIPDTAERNIENSDHLDDHGNKVEYNCISWYDGCNQCSAKNGELDSCTEKKCIHQDTPKCLEFKDLKEIDNNCDGVDDDCDGIEGTDPSISNSSEEDNDCSGGMIISETDDWFEVCITKTSDAGKACTSSSECESFCVASDATDIPRRGSCYGETPFMGCLDTLEGKRIATVCS